MGFTSFPFAFARDITDAVNSVRRNLQPTACPPVLYHNTSFRGISGILNTRTMWATCVDDLEDETEIEHGVKTVEAEIRQRRLGGKKSVVGRLLQLVPELLRERRRWTFVACFRRTLERPPDTDSALAAKCAKWDRDHPYCVEFETLSNWKPRLRLGIRSDQQYHRVVYDRDVQRTAVARAIAKVIDLASKNCTGALEGPLAEGLAKSHARLVAQSLIDMVCGFKSPSYSWEDEWRIVCRPATRLASSAPEFEDDHFSPYVKSGPTRHVELAAHEQGPISSLFQPRVLPFRAIYVSDSTNSFVRERQLIRSMLDDSGYSEVPIWSAQ
ncbi:MAG: hypothetical protein JOZ48_14435 [Acidobacteriaceae bacterium]|nr:hypothetical protein [Acidobacteriaceae bacterium]